MFILNQSTFQLTPKPNCHPQTAPFSLIYFFKVFCFPYCKSWSFGVDILKFDDLILTCVLSVVCAISRGKTETVNQNSSFLGWTWSLISQRVFRWMYRIFFTDNFKKKTNNSFVIMCKGKYCRRKKVHFLENLKINWVKKQYPIWSFSVSEKLQSELSTDIENLFGKAYT